MPIKMLLNLLHLKFILLTTRVEIFPIKPNYYLGANLGPIR